MPGRSQQKERERKRAAAFCQTLDVFLPTTKRKTTADGQQSAPLVEEANAAAAECGDDCRSSELVTSESNEPEITTPLSHDYESPRIVHPAGLVVL